MKNEKLPVPSRSVEIPDFRAAIVGRAERHGMTLRDVARRQQGMAQKSVEFYLYGTGKFADPDRLPHVDSLAWMLDAVGLRLAVVDEKGRVVA